jgi:hypothetical protein
VRGVWYTTGGSGARGVLIIVGTLLLLGSGAAAELATAVLAVLIALAVIVVLAVAAGVVFLVYRARREVRPQYRAEVVSGPGIRQQLADPVPAAIDPSAAHELHQHYHFHGVDEDRVAEILRRHQAG